MARDDLDLLPVNEDDLTMSPLVTVPNSDTETTEQTEEDDSPVKSVFDPRHRDPFLGLLYVGHLSKDVTLYGHEFSLQTPSQLARMEAGLLHKKYVGSVIAEQAWAAMTVALYLTHVDGSELPGTISPRGSGLEERFFWVTNNLKDLVIHEVFQECLILASEAEDALSELRRVSGETSG